jgi:hypothetical protein
MAFAAAAAVFTAPAAAALPAPQATFSAAFLPLAGGAVSLDGFGRGATPGLGVPEAADRSYESLGLREFFRDLWRIDTSAIAPGPYTLEPTLIEARGTLLFSSVSFRSYDALGALQIIDFTLNATGTQAVGGGPFTVLASCPVQVCVWIELTGTQLPGLPTEGYGGTVIGTPIPEPMSAALLGLGLAGVGLAVARRRRAAAL